MSISNRESPDPAAVQTPADLGSWSRPGVSLAVLGSPVKHSLSPQMHNAALAEMANRSGRFRNWRYFKFEVNPADLADALHVFHERRFLGINLTVPHKVEALDFVDEIDPRARELGAINTLVWSEEGYHGYNTDGYGLEQAVRQELSLEFADKRIFLLGAGGASRAAAVQILRGGCRHLHIGNRTAPRLNALLEILEGLGFGDRVSGFSIDEPPGEASDADLIVNATSLGLAADDPLPSPLDRYSADSAVYDMIYNPRETALLRTASERGQRTAHGLSMLVWQGARALEIWSGTAVPVEAMRAAAEAAL